MKKLVMIITILCMSLILGFTINSDANEAKAEDCGWWAQADQWDRFPCEGPPVDCYVLCPIIVTGSP